MLLKLYWLPPLAALGVAAMALWWAWGLGSPRPQEPVDVGRGLVLPVASEVADPPGWWGSLFLLIADATLFGSLLFGYAFLWTVAPNWPPPVWLQAGLWEPALGLGGAVLAIAGIRHGDWALRQGRGPWPGFLAAFMGALALTVAAITVFLGTDPDRHAYDATLWVLAGYVVLHAGLVALMTAFLAFRSAAGYLTGERVGEARIVRLWTDYAAATGLLGLAASWAPGLLA
jgi:cytochrome c oxidase subunit I+III